MPGATAGSTQTTSRRSDPEAVQWRKRGSRPRTSRALPSGAPQRAPQQHRYGRAPGTAPRAPLLGQRAAPLAARGAAAASRGLPEAPPPLRPRPAPRPGGCCRGRAAPTRPRVGAAASAPLPAAPGAGRGGRLSAGPTPPTPSTHTPPHLAAFRPAPSAATALTSAGGGGPGGAAGRGGALELAAARPPASVPASALSRRSGAASHSVRPRAPPGSNRRLRRKGSAGRRKVPPRRGGRKAAPGSCAESCPSAHGTTRPGLPRPPYCPSAPPGLGHPQLRAAVPAPQRQQKLLVHLRSSPSEANRLLLTAVKSKFPVQDIAGKDQGEKRALPKQGNEHNGSGRAQWFFISNVDCGIECTLSTHG